MERIATFMSQLHYFTVRFVNTVITTYIVPEYGVLFVASHRESITLQTEVDRCIMVPDVGHILVKQDKFISHFKYHNFKRKLAHYVHATRLFAAAIWCFTKQQHDSSPHADTSSVFSHTLPFNARKNSDF